MKLGALIRKLRQCKTLSSERKLVLSESARIRESLSSRDAPSLSLTSSSPHRHRARNVAKLIYIHTLGYPTAFGQIEAVTLMSSPRYNEKRIGYLALCTLMDETVEILPLIEHTLKKDLESENVLVQGLALTTIANLASEDLCRDLSSHIEELVKGRSKRSTVSVPTGGPLMSGTGMTHPGSRSPGGARSRNPGSSGSSSIVVGGPVIKKALQCARRICLKCPELRENYLSSGGSSGSSGGSSIGRLLRQGGGGAGTGGTTHGIICSVVVFLREMARFCVREKRKKKNPRMEDQEDRDDRRSDDDDDDETDSDCLVTLSSLRRYVGRLVRILNSLVMGNPYVSSSATSMASVRSDYESNGVCDPYLIVLILDLFRILCADSLVHSQSITDCLAAIPQRMERIAGKRGLRNSSVACVLYQYVMTVLGIEAEAGLREQALGILEKFVQARRNNNLRYLALNALRIVVSKYQDIEFVARFGDVVVDCLKSPDVSIRKRAVELICEMVNSDNIRFLVGELVGYLQSSPEDSELPQKIFRLIHQFCVDPTDEAEVSWKVNSMIRVILASGANLKPEITSAFIRMVVNELATQQQKLRTIRKLEMALRKIKAKPTLVKKQNPMIQVCVWCVGEFSRLIPIEGLVPPTPTPTETTEDETPAVVPIHYLLMRIFQTTETNLKTKLYVLTALLKVAGAHPQVKERIVQFMDRIVSAQIRIMERIRLYKSILDSEEDVERAVLERMPPFGEDEEEEGEEELDTPPKQPPRVVHSLIEEPTEPGEDPSLIPIDTLLRMSDDSPVTPTAGAGAGPATAVSDSRPVSGGPVREVTILDILTGAAEPSPSIGDQTSSTPPPSMPSLDDILGASSSASSDTDSSAAPAESPLLMPMTQPPSDSIAGLRGDIMVYEDSDLRVNFELVKSSTNARVTMITAHLTNRTHAEFSGIDFRTSVPGYLKRQMMPPSATTLSALVDRGVSVRFRVLNSSNPKKPIVVRFKLEYTRSDIEERVVKVHAVKNIPLKF